MAGGLEARPHWAPVEGLCTPTGRGVGGIRDPVGGVRGALGGWQGV